MYEWTIPAICHDVWMSMSNDSSDACVSFTEMMHICHQQTITAMCGPMNGSIDESNPFLKFKVRSELKSDLKRFKKQLQGPFLNTSQLDLTRSLLCESGTAQKRLENRSPDQSWALSVFLNFFQ